MVVTVFVGALLGVLIVVQATLLATAITRVIDREGEDGLAVLLVALASVVVGRAVLAWAQEASSQRAAAIAKSELRTRLVEHSASIAADPGQTARRAEVAALAGGGLDALDGYFGKYLPQLILAVVVPIAVLLQLFRTDVTSAVTVVVTLPLIPIFMVLVGRMTERANARRWDALARLSHHFLDVVEGMPTLRAFGRGSVQPALVGASADRYRTTTMSTLRVAFLSSLVLELLATISVALVAVGVGLRLVDGGLDLRTGLLAILLAPEAYLPLRQVGAHYHSSAAGLAAAGRAFAMLDLQPLRHDGLAAVPTGPMSVRMSAITVRHPGRERPAPDHADLVVNAGEMVALAGPSGTGKSSLLAVLLGLRSPDSGSVSVGFGDASVSLADIDLAAWHRSISWVDQQPYVMAGSLADNLRIARPAASDDELSDALRRAGLPGAIHRTVGHDAVGLSAGERRRLGLARALLRGAPLVLLDEPTAGLDAATEDDVLAAVREEANRGAAVLVVSHRPAVLQAADRVVTLR